MEFSIKEENNFKYLEQGSGKTLLLLHGLFGAMSNFAEMITHFSKDYKVVFPLLPIYEGADELPTVPSLVQHVRDFVKFRGLESVSLVGNSLGGHIALLYSLEYLSEIDCLTLTGSSGLFENTMGNTFPKRGDYEFIKTKTESTFYDPAVATKEMVDEVYDIVNDRAKALCILSTAKSAIRENLAERLDQITVPSLLIWGANDEITPPFVAEEFHNILPNSELHFIDKCGHAPMMERPDSFNTLMDAFLKNHLSTKSS